MYRLPKEGEHVFISAKCVKTIVNELDVNSKNKKYMQNTSIQYHDAHHHR